VPIIDWQDVAADTNGFLIAGRGPWDIRVLFVNNDGAAPRGIEYLWSYPRTPLYVRWTGTNFITFFSPFAKRLDADGRVIDDDQRPPLIDPNTFPLSIVTTPDELFVLSFDGRTPELSLAEPARIRPSRH
jgi:hypothetical protein